METVYVSIPSSIYGGWAKTVTSVAANAANGHDWAGDWLAVGCQVDLEPGTLYILCEKGRKNTDYTLKVVLPNGKTRSIDTSSEKGWGQQMRKVAREWLALSPETRIVRAAQERIDEIAHMDEEKRQTLAGDVETRTQWIAQYGGQSVPEDERTAALQTIRDLMAEHEITLDELAEGLPT